MDGREQVDEKIRRKEGGWMEMRGSWHIDRERQTMNDSVYMHMREPSKRKTKREQKVVQEVQKQGH